MKSKNYQSDIVINFIKNHFCHIYNPNRNLRKYLFELAGRQSAEYIVEKMLTVRTFSHNFDLLKYALSKVEIEGLYLEFGVFSGNTINHISRIKSNQVIYGFDSFEGLPEDWRSGFEEKCFSVKTLPQVNRNVELIKGWFNESLPIFVKKHEEQCAFIHIDCDLYSSTKIIFENLKKKIKSGTILVFDEYFNYPGWQEHEFKAFQEFIKETGLKYKYLGYVETHEQVAVRIL